MKKTLIVTLEYPPEIGGIATYVHELALALGPANIIVLAPLNRASADWDTDLPYRVIRKRLLLPRFFWPRWILILWHVLLVAKREQIEVVLIHHLLPVGYAGVVVNRLMRIPYIVFLHGTDFVSSIRTSWKAKMANLVTERAKGLVFNSQSLHDRFAGAFPAVSRKAIIVYPCPAASYFDRPPEETLERLRSRYALHGKKVMLSVSRLGEGKGFPHLMRLIPDLLATIPKLVWLVVGAGPKDGYLREEARKRSLHNVVRFVGRVSQTELPAYYYLADLFVLLTHPDETRGSEGFGMVFLEASAVGLPIVAGRSGGVEEAVKHLETGVLVDSYQSEEVVACIRGLFADAAAARRLGDAARARVASEFQWPHQVAKLLPWLE